MSHTVMKPAVTITGDGSSTVYLPGLNEHYHSTHGAVQESRHVFIEAGLKILKKDNIRVFEMGFGTGLNALLSALEYSNRIGNTCDGRTQHAVATRLDAGSGGFSSKRTILSPSNRTTPYLLARFISPISCTAISS